MGAFLTSLGGTAVQMVNRTGAMSVKGSLVSVGDVAGSVKLTPADVPNPIGVMLINGVPDGGDCWVVVSGIAEALLQDSTAASIGYWAKVSKSQDGRIDCTNQLPPGGTIAALNDHSNEVGHCLDGATAGTNVLVRVALHFN